MVYKQFNAFFLSHLYYMFDIVFVWYQIVFSDAWWIGSPAENPEEARLDFPKELSNVNFPAYLSSLVVLTNIFFVLGLFIPNVDN